MALSGKLVGECRRCGEDVFYDEEGQLPSGAVARNDKCCLCPHCNRAGKRMSDQGVGLGSFDGMEESAVKEMWKEARKYQKGALKAFCTETLEKSKTTREEHGLNTKPMPLAWYGNQGFNTKHIEEHFHPTEVAGTPCYSVPLAYMQELTREDDKRSQTHVVEPSQRQVLKSSGGGGARGMPPSTLPESEWSAEQWAKFKEHAVGVANASMKELNAKMEAHSKYSLPPFMAQQVDNMTQRWDALKEVFGVSGSEVDPKARSMLKDDTTAHRSLLQSLNSVFKTFAKMDPDCMGSKAQGSEARGGQAQGSEGSKAPGGKAKPRSKAKGSKAQGGKAKGSKAKGGKATGGKAKGSKAQGKKVAEGSSPAAKAL